MSPTDATTWMAWGDGGGIVVRVDARGITVELICDRILRRDLQHCPLATFVGEPATEAAERLRGWIARHLDPARIIDIDDAVRSRLATTETSHR
jgi:hypothetical protein